MRRCRLLFCIIIATLLIGCREGKIVYDSQVSLFETDRFYPYFLADPQGHFLDSLEHIEKITVMHCKYHWIFDVPCVFDEASRQDSSFFQFFMFSEHEGHMESAIIVTAEKYIDKWLITKTIVDKSPSYSMSFIEKGVLPTIQRSRKLYGNEILPFLIKIYSECVKNDRSYAMEYVRTDYKVDMFLKKPSVRVSNDKIFPIEIKNAIDSVFIDNW